MLHNNKLTFSEGFLYQDFTNFFISCIQRYKKFWKEILETISFKYLLLKADLPEL